MRPVRIITAFIFAAAVAITGCSADAAIHPPAGPTQRSPAAPPTTATHGGGPMPAPRPPTPPTTLPLGHIERLNAIQVVGSRTVWAVGTGAILTTGDGGRTWTRVWHGAQELLQVDFVSASTGWALGNHILLGTADGGRHWRQLGQPAVGPLRQVHFASPTRGWGVAGGNDRPKGGPVPQGATRLVQTSDGGRSWTALAAPAPPQSVCFTAPDDGWLASGTGVWRSVDGGRHWSPRPGFTLPLSYTYMPSAELQCAEPGAAWVLFDSGEGAAGSHPYALYATGDGGAHWRGVLAVFGGQDLPAAPGRYPGPFSVIDPQRAFLLSPTPAAGATGAVRISQGGLRLQRLPDLPGTTLFMPRGVSFASATHGWAVGADLAGRTVLLATGDGGHSWHSQLPT
jgi:hypothetical protein